MSDTHNFPQRVRVLRAKKGLSQPDFAKLMGFSRGTLSSVEGGKRPSKRFVLQLEAQERLERSAPRSESAVHRSNGSELGESLKITGRLDDSHGNAVIVKTRNVPVVSWAQAGQATDYEELPLDWQKSVPTLMADEKAFAVQIAGDSMEPRYHAGDVAYLSPSSPVFQNDTVIARLADQGVVFKIYSRKGDTITLSSYNPAYSPFEVPAEKILWVYPVHSVMKILSK